MILRKSLRKAIRAVIDYRGLAHCEVLRVYEVGVRGQDQILDTNSLNSTAPNKSTTTGSAYHSNANVKTKTWKESMEKTFDFPEASVNRVLLKKSAIANLNEAQMARTRDVLVKYGFPIGALQECPDLLTLRSGALENYIRIMKETGFTSIRPFLLATYPSISRKSLGVIRKSGLIPENEGVIERYFNLLELPSQIRSNILSALPQDPNELSLMSLRILILEHFLASKLGTEVKECRRLISQNPRIKHRCYEWITASIKILRTDLNFTPQKIMRNGTLLQGDPENFKAILNTVQTLGGIPIQQLGIRRPKIMLVKADTLCRMKQMFKEHGITDEALAKCPEIFTLSAETVAARLKIVDETPALLSLKSHPRFCRILYYFQKVKERLDYFSALDVTGVSLHVLSLDQEKFSNYVKKGDLRNKGGDLVHLIAKSLNLPKAEVREALSVHPHWLHIPTVYAKEVLQFLQKSFTRNQLSIAIPIMLYPLDNVKEAVQEVLTENTAEIKNHPNFLHLVLYNLEKEFHFSGDGVWTSYHQLRHDTSETDDTNQTAIPT